jgi:phosphatidylglycerophosphate synthase
VSEATPPKAQAGSAGQLPAQGGSGAGRPPAPASYRVQDDELLLEFYKKTLWNRIVPRIPASIAPNTLTIVGQACGVLSAVATGAAVAGHPIFFLVSCFLLLAYLTFDNIDGAHARRTGQTSPLGEFLDHGLDGMASCAILIVASFVLALEQTWLVLLCTLGAFGFVALFWEQFRTGLLVIPRFSSTEGVTLLVLYQLVRFFVGSPDWLAFSYEQVTVGTVLATAVLAGYVGAAIPSVRRAAKLGVSGWELAPLAVLMSAQLAFSALGAHALVCATTVGLIGANVTCRMILLRHRGDTHPFIAPMMWLTVLPLIVPAIAPGAWTPTGWALISLAIVAIDYGKNLWLGGNELLGRRREARIA